MIVAGKMQHTVQDEDFEFAGKGVPIEVSILQGNFCRDGDVASAFPRKRQDIGGLVLLAKATVEFPDAIIAGNQNSDLAGDTGQLLCAPGKPREAGFVDLLYVAFDDNHSLQNKSGGRLKPSQ